jgi:O-antigen/teichoic acid export membrane protein
MIARALKNKILWSTFIQYFGKLLQIAIGIVSIKLVTNALGPEEYGLYGKIAEVALFLSTTANLGIFGNTVRKMSTHPQDGKLFINALFLRFISIILFLVVGLAYSQFALDSTFTLGLLFFACSLLFDNLTSIATAMLQTNYLMGRSVFAVTLGRIAELGIIFLLIQNVSTAPLFFLAPLTAAAISLCLSMLFASHRIKFHYKLDTQILKSLLLTSIPFGIINILNNAYYRFMPSFFAAQVLTDADYGRYNLTLSAVASVAILSTFLMYSVLPVFKQSLKEKHFQRAKELYIKVKRSLIALGALAIVSGSILGPYLLTLVSSGEFTNNALWFMLPLMLTITAASYLYDLVLITLFGLEKEIWFLKWEAIALLASSILFITSLGQFTQETSLILILLAALTGESIMVIVGMRKISAIFQKGQVKLK